MLTKPLGRVPYKNLSEIPYNDGCTSMYRRPHPTPDIFKGFFDTNRFLKYYKFRLNKFLRLNITILELNIPHSAAGQLCPSGSVWIWKFLGFPDIRHFCGRMSHISCYPFSDKAEVGVESKVFVIVKADLNFTVIDKDVVQSKETTSTEQKQTEPQWSYWFPSRRTGLFIYQITAQPVEKITVFFSNMTNTETKAFDGPAAKSKELDAHHWKNQSYYFISSKFQMAIYNTRQTNKKCTFLFKFSLHSGEVNISIGENKTKIIFPELKPCGKLLFCIVKLKSPLGFHLNLTLSHMLYAGDMNTEDCKYAGVWIADAYNERETSKQFNEIYHSCVKEYFDVSYQHDCFYDPRLSQYLAISYHYIAFGVSTEHTHFPHGSDKVPIYSTKSDIIIIFYGFKEYGVMSLQIEASVTSCEIVHVDICKIGSLHNSTHYFNLFVFGKKAEFKNLFLYTGDTLLLTGKQQCTVFQIKAYAMNTTNSPENICKLHINFLAQGFKLSAIADGHIEGEWVCVDRTCDLSVISHWWSKGVLLKGFQANKTKVCPGK